MLGVMKRYTERERERLVVESDPNGARLSAQDRRDWD
jgi:hypothetical protein